MDQANVRIHQLEHELADVRQELLNSNQDHINTLTQYNNMLDRMREFTTSNGDTLQKLGETTNFIRLRTRFTQKL